jgi:hypothetical protein
VSFIGGRGRAGGGQRWGSGGVRRSTPGAEALGACWRGELMASRYCRHALACSCGSASCREAEGTERGSGCFSSSFLSGLTAGVRAGEMGSRQRGREGVSAGTATGLGHTRDGVGYSEFGFPNFCPERVRHNVRKNSNFEFLKISNWGGQDIG